MATIKEEEYPIKDNGFEYLGNHYDCQYAIERDIKVNYHRLKAVACHKAIRLLTIG